MPLMIANGSDIYKCASGDGLKGERGGEGGMQVNKKIGYRLIWKERCVRYESFLGPREESTH